MTEDQASIFNLQQDLLANAALQRGPSPSGPNPNNCKRIFNDILTYLQGGTLERQVSSNLGKEITRGVIERYGQMRVDSWNLWGAEDAGIPGIGSWKGHRDIYNEMRKDLKNLVDAWKNGNCDKWDGTKEHSPSEMAKVIAEAEKWMDQKPPVAPDRILQQQKEQGWQLPTFEIPKLEIPDWIWIVPRILWGNPQQAEQQSDNQIALQEQPQNSTLESLNPGLYEALNRITSDTTNQPDSTQEEVTVQSLNPGLYQALESITNYTALQNTYLAQWQESRAQQVNNTDQQVIQTRPQLEYD